MDFRFLLTVLAQPRTFNSTTCRIFHGHENSRIKQPSTAPQAGVRRRLMVIVWRSRILGSPMTSSSSCDQGMSRLEDHRVRRGSPLTHTLLSHAANLVEHGGKILGTTVSIYWNELEQDEYTLTSGRDEVCGLVSEARTSRGNCMIRDSVA